MLFRSDLIERAVRLLLASEARADVELSVAFVGDDEIGLTPTEFCLLEQFMRNPGDVISKARFLESCWDWAFEGDPNIVEVYIGHLRNKLDRPFGRTTFQTVRGAGYRLAHDGR